MFDPLLGLPVRVTADLRIEADPGAQLSPTQGFAVAEQIIQAAASLIVQTPRSTRRRSAAGAAKASRTA